MILASTEEKPVYNISDAHFHGKVHGKVVSFSNQSDSTITFRSHLHHTNTFTTKFYHPNHTFVTDSYVKWHSKR